MASSVSKVLTVVTLLQPEAVGVLLKGDDAKESSSEPDGTKREQQDGNERVDESKKAVGSGGLLERPQTDVNQFINDFHFRFTGWTPLLKACCQNQPEVVQLLLEDCDIKVNQANPRGCTPLWFACSRGYSEIVQLLLEHSQINVNQSKTDGVAPLLIACQNNQTQAVQHLLQHPKTNVNHADSTDVTALFNACSFGHFKITRVLLSHSQIDVNQSCNGNKKAFPTVSQPIARYCNSENLGITVGINNDHVLVAKFSNDENFPIQWDGNCYTMRNSAGTIYTAKAKSNGFQDGGTIPDELIWNDEKGIVVIWRSESIGQPRNALLAACQNGHTEIVQDLLTRKDIKTDTVFTDGSTAIEMAIRNGHEDVVYVLEEYFYDHLL